jgi:hypothetical protein
LKWVGGLKTEKLEEFLGCDARVVVEDTRHLNEGAFNSNVSRVGDICAILNVKM